MRLEPAAPARGEVRKTVTVLFSDVTGSTAMGESLDAEAVRTLMARYFGAMRAVIERHGGTVEKFIGDAIMAVFGIPTIHEDDAVRAVRAAAQMREALAALNAELERERGVAIATRTGIMTGEVVAGDPSAGATLVTGDTVNTAARLEQAAAPGEILIGSPTYRLVRDAVTAEPVEAVAAKGKELPVPAYRLISVTAGLEGHLRRLDAPLVGRERELARLEQAFRDAVGEGRCGLFTLLGTAGVGKSRLVEEFLMGVRSEARVLRGRCLPYGEGITYWPLAEALKDAAAIGDADDRRAAQHKLLRLLDGERDAELLAARLATAIGLSDDPAPQTELFWAVRRTLEHLARQCALVVVWEDIHWAEPTFLDLIDHLADWSRDAPILLLAPARPEFLDARPGWGGGKLNATTVLLEALPADAAGRLIDALPGGSALPVSVKQRIAAAAEGNPLFVEELLGMLIDDGLLRQVDGAWEAAGDVERLEIPPTIQALLAARLDRLSISEREVAQRASVVGRVFEPEALAALAPASEPGLAERLMALVRKELVRPDRSEVTGGDAFKFRHVLIQDAAYAALPKRERADLHERFADWLEAAAGDRVSEFDEIIGHHLEKAHRYQLEFGGHASSVLADRAADVLARAATRAGERGDWAAAVILFQHAGSVTSDRTRSLLLEEQRTWVLRFAGEYSAARDAAGALAARALQAGNVALGRRAELFATDSATFVDAGAYAALRQRLPVIRRELEGFDDPVGSVLLETAQASIHMIDLQWGKAYEAWHRALDRPIEPRLRLYVLPAAPNLPMSAMLGPTPLSEARAATRMLWERMGPAEYPTGLRTFEVCFDVLEHGYEATATAVDDVRRLFADIKDDVSLALTLTTLGWVIGLAGEYEAAVKLSAEAAVRFDTLGAATARRSTSGDLAESLARLGRVDEAEEPLKDAHGADPADIAPHLVAARVEARIAVRRGALDEADRHAAAAASLLEGAEAPLDEAELHIVRSEIHSARGDVASACTSLELARSLLAAKGADAVVRRVDALIRGAACTG